MLSSWTAVRAGIIVTVLFFLNRNCSLACCGSREESTKSDNGSSSQTVNANQTQEQTNTKQTQEQTITKQTQEQTIKKQTQEETKTKQTQEQTTQTQEQTKTILTQEHAQCDSHNEEDKDLGTSIGEGLQIGFFFMSLKKFSTKLFEEILKQEDIRGKSFIFSPYSIHILLSMAAMGAGGSTQTDLLKGLGNADTKMLKTGHLKLKRFFQNNVSIPDMNASEVVVLSNHIFMKEAKKINKEFLETAECDFECNLENFDSSPGKTAKKINKQVENDTHGEIKELVSEETVAAAEFIMINAVLFNASWEAKFDKYTETPTDDFFLPDGQCQKVLLMNTSGLMPYLEEKEIKAHVVRLDYKEEPMAMVVVLPLEKDGLDDVEAAILKEYNGDLTGLFKDLDKRDPDIYEPGYHVTLRFPMFEINQDKYQFNKVATDMGMGEMFGDQANFKNICENCDISISQLYQQAKIAVNEVGTIASASTAIKWETRMVTDTKPKKVNLTADHPFLFFIKDNKYNTILFYGRFRGDSKKPSNPC